MKVALRIENGDRKGKLIQLSVSEVRIGRGRECQIRIPNTSVSRRHCTLLIRDREVLVRDDSSAHGTFVNRRRLRGEWQVEDGDTLQVGSFAFTVLVEQEPDSASDAELVFDEPPLSAAEGSTRIGGEVLNPGELDPDELERIKNRLGDLG